MKLNKIAFAVISAVCVFTFFSCELLTKPLLEQIGLGDVLKYAPDAQSLGNASTDVLANAAGDISIAADPDASRAVLGALGAKTADEIGRLSDEQKSNILSLTTSAILPVDQIISVATDAMSSAEGNGGNSGNTDDAESTQEVVGSMIDSIEFTDTRATEKILLAKVPSSSAEISDEELPNILLATISVAISACKSAEETVNLGTPGFGNAMQEFMKVFDENDRNNVNVDTILNNLSATGPSGVSNQGRSSLSNAITVFQRLGNRVSAESLMGIFTGGMMNN
jgi:hypothetical protein